MNHISADGSTSCRAIGMLRGPSLPKVVSIAIGMSPMRSTSFRWSSERSWDWSLVWSSALMTVPYPTARRTTRRAADGPRRWANVPGMSGPGIDPAFTALPYRQLGDVALARAAEHGVSHADFRFERVQYQTVAARDGV